MLHRPSKMSTSASVVLLPTDAHTSTCTGAGLTTTVGVGRTSYTGPLAVLILLAAWVLARDSFTTVRAGILQGENMNHRRCQHHVLTSKVERYKITYIMVRTPSSNVRSSQVGVAVPSRAMSGSTSHGGIVPLLFTSGGTDAGVGTGTHCGVVADVVGGTGVVLVLL